MEGLTKFRYRLGRDLGQIDVPDDLQNVFRPSPPTPLSHFPGAASSAYRLLGFSTLYFLFLTFLRPQTTQFSQFT